MRVKRHGRSHSKVSESGAVLDDQWRLGLLIVSGFPAAYLCARWAFSRQYGGDPDSAHLPLGLLDKLQSAGIGYLGLGHLRGGSPRFQSGPSTKEDLVADQVAGSKQFDVHAVECCSGQLITGPASHNTISSTNCIVIRFDRVHIELTSST